MTEPTNAAEQANGAAPDWNQRITALQARTRAEQHPQADTLAELEGLLYELETELDGL